MHRRLVVGIRRVLQDRLAESRRWCEGIRTVAPGVSFVPQTLSRSPLAATQRCPILSLCSSGCFVVASTGKSMGAEGDWCLRRSSKPRSPAKTRVGGFDSHTLPPVCFAGSSQEVSSGGPLRHAHPASNRFAPQLVRESATNGWKRMRLHPPEA